MTNSNALWEDMSRLNALYEELMWPPDDRLTFRIEGNKIIISNLSQELREYKRMKTGIVLITYLQLHQLQE